MEGVSGVRVFRRDAQEGTTGDFRPVHQSVDFRQSLMYLLGVARLKEIVPKCLIAVVQVSEHERILAFKVPVKGRLGDSGDGHDLLRPGSADSLRIKQADRGL